MKTAVPISKIISIFLLILTCCFSNVSAQKSANQQPLGTQPTVSETPRQRMNSVQVTDFYLKTGELISGRVIYEDKNKITIEYPQESEIVVATYPKREIDTRTVNTKAVLESKYYIELAEYFSAKTGDFRNDPDDFIQAIRCCEKAKRAISEAKRPEREVDRVNKQIEQLQKDREVWQREVQSRAKLKNLELEATLIQRINNLEKKVNATNQQANKSVEQMKKTIEALKINNQRLEQSLARIDEYSTRQLRILENRIEENRRYITRRRYYNRPYYYYPLKPAPESQDNENP